MYVMANFPTLEASYHWKMSNDTFVPVHTDYPGFFIKTFWNEPNMLLQAIAYVIKVLGLKTISLDLKDCYHQEDFVAIMNQVKAKGLRFDKITHSGYNLTRFPILVEQSRNIDNLEVERWDPDFQKSHELHVGSLFVRNASGISESNLQALTNCMAIHLNQVRMRDEDVRQFIQRWLFGGGRVKSITLNMMNPMNTTEMIMGLNNIIWKGGNHQSDSNRSYKIQRSDGALITLERSSNTVTMQFTYPPDYLH